MNRFSYPALGFVLALVWTIAAAQLWAETPKPKPKTGVSAEEPEIEDPAVAAILATKPVTPTECVKAAKILADLGRADLAKPFLKKVLEANLDSRQWADLGEELGSPMFLELADRASLAPQGKRVANSVARAMNARQQSAERIKEFVGQLRDSKTFVPAIKGLQEARGAAVGPLLAVLADPARAAEHANVRAALVEMGSLARGPLIAIVDQADPQMAVEAIEVIGAAKYPAAAMYLLRPYLAESSDPAVRKAATAQLRQMSSRLPDRNEAIRLLTDAAKAYFNGRQPIEGEVNGRVELWRWDATKRRCVVKNVAPATAARAMAARLARDAHAIAPDNRDVRTLYLMTLLERAAYDNGLDRALSPTDHAAIEAKRLGVKPIEETLARAMADGHFGAAAAAACLLGEIGKANELLADGAQPSPLTRSLQSPDRRLRMAAIQAIVRLQPLRAFAGSSQLPQALAFFAATAGTRHALVAAPNAEEASSLAGLLSAAGYQVDTCSSGKDLLFRAARSPDYELALIDVTIDKPVINILLQQLRHEPRTASLRIGLIARSGFLERAEHLADADSLTKAFSRPRDDKSLQWQLDQLATLEPDAFVSFEARQRQAAEALDLMAELCRTSERVYDLRRLQESTISALYVPTLANKAVNVLALMNSADAQRALADLAGRFTRPLALRQAAAKAFRQNSEKYGILLTTDEIRQQYRRYNASKGQDAASRRVLGFILDCLEARTVKSG